MTAPQFAAAIPAAIRRDPGLANRIRTVTVAARDEAGIPLADTDIVVEQLTHAFGFGNIGFDLIDFANVRTSEDGGVEQSLAEAEVLAAQWLSLFNMATLPFYWRWFESTRGRPDTDRLRRAADWFVERGVRVKGHPLVWHTLAPRWLLEVPESKVLDAILDRVAREVTDFAGAVDLWDVVNEAVILPVFDKEDNAVTRLARRMGRPALLGAAFSAARQANPAVRLVINDFDLSSDYERVIDECLTAGVPIDAIGLQTHMHQGYWGADRMLAKVDRFARFGLPIQMTETTLLSGNLMPPEIVDLNDYQVPEWPSTPAGEDRQAREMAEHYRSLLSHPSIESITYWGLTDVGAWLGAPAGIVRADGSPKPAYAALAELIHGDWWLGRTTVRTSAAGEFEVSAMAGDFALDAVGRRAVLRVEPDVSTVAVTLSPATP